MKVKILKCSPFDNIEEALNYIISDKEVYDIKYIPVIHDLFIIIHYNEK